MYHTVCYNVGGIIMCSQTSVKVSVSEFCYPTALQYTGFLGAPGNCLPTPGPVRHSPPSHYKPGGEGLQATTATTAILNLSTRYRSNMESISGRPLASSTKVVKLDQLFHVVILKQLWFVYKKGETSKGQFLTNVCCLWWRRNKRSPSVKH